MGAYEPQGRHQDVDDASVASLLNELDADLRNIAEAYMRRERPDHTLQPTALIHEAYLRMADDSKLHWESKFQFLAVAAQMMRRILVEHARSKRRQKRGGGWQRIPFEGAARDLALPTVELLDLDEAMVALDAVHPRSSRVVEMRFFGGLTLAEIATQIGVSKRTVEDDWYMARAWLQQRLADVS